MFKMVFTCAISILLSCHHVEASESYVAIEHFPDFEGANIYTVKPSDAYANIVKMDIPDGHVIRTNGIKEIKWHVQYLTIGKNATIDVSSIAVTPEKPTKADDDLSQAPKCKVGGFGPDGSPGGDGSQGTSLTIDGLFAVHNPGSLWIKTDGSSGGNGGDAGRGGQGGGPGRVFLIHCGAEVGGRGGIGGQGGNGGSTALVSISLAPELGKPPIKIDPHCSSVCGRSTRPDQANGSTTVINVYGAPGCGGKGGTGGGGGPGGEADAGWGSSGPSGGLGSPGACNGIVDHD